MSGGSVPVRATFWLLDAPDSLREQSRREPDGTGVGYFDSAGRPRIARQPMAAWRDRAFAREARSVTSRTFVAHVRYASTGEVAERNTHPFVRGKLILAHHGVVGGIDEIEHELGPLRFHIEGDTDSERVLALIARETQRAGGDVSRGIVEAVRWLSANVPVYALNIVVATPTDLFALRYPQTHELWLLERRGGGTSGHRHLDVAGRRHLRVRSPDLQQQAAVIVASEPMDEDTGWTLLEPGELLHVRADLHVERRVVIADPPRDQLTEERLDAQAAASQLS